MSIGVLFPFARGLIITVLLTKVLKEIVKAPRPPEFPNDDWTRDKYSFPSGHSSAVTYIFGYIYFKNPCPLRALLFAIMWYKVAYGSYSDGYHRLSEVFAGTLLGGTVAYYSAK